MCLGVPGEIKEIYPAGDLTMARIDFGGVTKEACLAYVPEAKVDDWVIVHVGFAITLLDQEAAMETLDVLRRTGAFDEQLGPMADGYTGQESA